jgi:hypothetical protein
MPLKMNASQSDDIFIVGLDDANKPGDKLQAGQTSTLTSADPATWVITQDPAGSERPTDKDYTLSDGTVVPAGTATLASAKIKAAASPAQPNVPINITNHLANADGTPVLDDTGAAIADDVDTATLVPNLVRKVGMLFGTAV